MLNIFRKKNKFHDISLGTMYVATPSDVCFDGLLFIVCGNHKDMEHIQDSFYSYLPEKIAWQVVVVEGITEFNELFTEEKINNINNNRTAENVNKIVINILEEIGYELQRSKGTFNEK